MPPNRPPTEREKQIRAIADGAGVSYESVVYQGRMLEPLGREYAPIFGRGIRGARLNLRQLLSLTIAISFNSPPRTVELVPAILSAPFYDDCFSIRHWTDHDKRTLKDHFAQVLAILDDPENEKPRGDFPTFFLAIETIISKLSSPNRDRFFDQANDLGFEIRISADPNPTADISFSLGSGVDLVSRFSAAPSAAKQAGALPAIRRENAVISLEFIDLLASLLKSAPLKETSDD